MKTIRVLFLLLVVGGFAYLFYRLVGPDRGPEVAEKAAWAQTDADADLEGLCYREWQGGALAWIMNARVAEFYYGREQAEFSGVKVVYFEPSGEAIHLQAEKAFYDNRTRVLTATGNVDVQSAQGYRFQSQTVYYNSRDRQLRSQDKVTFTTDRISIEGVGIDGSLRDQSFVLLSEVKAVFAPMK